MAIAAAVTACRAAWLWWRASRATLRDATGYEVDHTHTWAMPAALQLGLMASETAVLASHSARINAQAARWAGVSGLAALVAALLGCAMLWWQVAQ